VAGIDRQCIFVLLARLGKALRVEIQIAELNPDFDFSRASEGQWLVMTVSAVTAP